MLSGKEVSPDQVVCYSPGAEHYFRTTGEWNWLAASLPTTAVAAAGDALLGHPLAAPAATKIMRIPAHLMLRLRNLHKSTAFLAGNPPDLLVHSEVAKAIEQELISAAVACLTTDAEVKADLYPSRRASVMQRFEQAIQAKQGEPIYLTEICAEIGAPERTLRLCCDEHLGMGPKRYLWLRRMHLAHKALILAHPSANTVTGIASDYGFYELGRFAVAYRRQFNESPSATLRRLP